MPILIQEHFKCIGCGACAAIEPTDWEMQGDKAVIIDSDKFENEIYEKKLDDLRQNEDAAAACPVNCIHIKKDDE